MTMVHTGRRSARRRWTLLALSLVAATVVLSIQSIQPARAADGTDDATRAPVDVVEVSGFLDRPVADNIERAIARANSDGAQAIVLQLNSKRATVSRARMAELARAIADSPVLVAIWVGPAGSRAYGLSGQLLGVAPVTAMASGSRVGHFGVPLAVSGLSLDFGSAASDLARGSLGAEEAKARGVLRSSITDPTVPTLANMLLALDGVQYKGRTLSTASGQVDPSGKRELIAPARLYKLELLSRLMHTVASPPVAYLLLTIGLGLLVFELFTAGVGIAGVVGAFCLVLGCYGAAALPTRGWALALLVLSFVAFAVDIQTGVPRVWTGVGIVGYVVASVFLYDGLSISWITLLVAIAGVLASFVTGMPSMVRTRFATPTIGREWMVGESGEAVVAVSPEGVVLVRGAQWRARTNRATPIEAGAAVRVVGIDGVTLEVEPAEGGARDYRERAREHRGSRAGQDDS
jgi:membrane-bound serine protease (ClpP class)